MNSTIPKKMRTGVISISHGEIAAHGYGNLPFAVPSNPGENLVALSPITKDPALQLTVGYQSGWYLAYYNAYNGQAGAGEFQVRYAFAK